jgi:hypothetical protein
MLRQKAGKLELTLQNETAGYAKDVYRDDSPDKALKVVPDAELQLLLDVFAEQGMFAAQPPPGPDALDVLVVAQAGRTWSWARRQRGMQASEMPFLQAKQYFLNVYNGNTAYHGTGDQKPDFRNERLRAQDEAAAASRRLRDLPRQP